MSGISMEKCPVLVAPFSRKLLVRYETKTSFQPLHESLEMTDSRHDDQGTEEDTARPPWMSEHPVIARSPINNTINNQNELEAVATSNENELVDESQHRNSEFNEDDYLASQDYPERSALPIPGLITGHV